MSLTNDGKDGTRSYRAPSTGDQIARRQPAQLRAPRALPPGRVCPAVWSPPTPSRLRPTPGMVPDLTCACARAIRLVPLCVNGHVVTPDARLVPLVAYHLTHSHPTILHPTTITSWGSHFALTRQSLSVNVVIDSTGKVLVV